MAENEFFTSGANSQRKAENILMCCYIDYLTFFAFSLLAFHSIMLSRSGCFELFFHILLMAPVSIYYYMLVYKEKVRLGEAYALTKIFDTI